MVRSNLVIFGENESSLRLCHGLYENTMFAHRPYVGWYVDSRFKINKQVTFGANGGLVKWLSDRQHECKIGTVGSRLVRLHIAPVWGDEQTIGTSSRVKRFPAQVKVCRTFQTVHTSTELWIGYRCVWVFVASRVIKITSSFKVNSDRIPYFYYQKYSSRANRGIARCISIWSLRNLHIEKWLAHPILHSFEPMCNLASSDQSPSSDYETYFIGAP